MCRYSDAGYKTSWVCLNDRHVARYQPNMVSQGAPPEEWLSATPRCPFCREEMIDFGHDFKAPRKRNNQWRKLKILHDKGIHFNSCGCSGPGWRPATLGAAKRSQTTRLNATRKR